MAAKKKSKWPAKPPVRTVGPQDFHDAVIRKVVSSGAYWNRTVQLKRPPPST